MLKRLIAVSLVLTVAAPVLAQTVVAHVPNKVTGWRGGNNHSPSYCWMDSWPNNGDWGPWQDATLAEFDRTELRNAINSTIDSFGGWDAQVLVTQPEWVSGDPAITIPGLQPVLGSAQVDAAAIDWTTATSLTAGLSSWALGGTTYNYFGDAVLAGVPTGQSAVFETIPWTTQPRLPLYDVIMDAPENLIVQYMKNTAATGIFASAKTPISAALSIYHNQNLASDIRVQISAPPFGKPWMNPVIGGDKYKLWVAETIIQGAAPKTISVQVKRLRAGTLAWTATESPDVAWLSLANASGTNDSIFQMTLNATGVAAGTYNTAVVISDPNANNPTVTIPVTLTVQSDSPVIQLVPASLLFQATPTGSNPAPQTVTVNNSGSGTLSWTAAENPDVAWMSISPTTGSSGGTFTVTINKTGLATGSHTGTIRVTDSGASNSPQNLTVTLNIQDQDASVTTANSYDDAWQSGPTGWVAAMQAVRAGRPAGVAATSGFCVFLGDSITYSSAFGTWARAGNGKTPEDIAICNWTHASTGSSQTTNDGWFLAKFDVPGRNGSYTARSGITAAQYLAGFAAPDLPSMDKMFTAGFTNPDGKQYRDAEIAVILLGTNDLGGHTDVELAANLSTMVDKLQANGIIPVLTTIPPRSGQDAKVLTFVTAVRNLAQTRKLPLIDFYQEVMRRRPGSTWQNTLIDSDGVHPSPGRAGFNIDSDPYASNGAALSEVGYLLRTWLTVQKIKEVKAAVIDAPILIGDINGDGLVNVGDLQALVAAWGSTGGPPASGNWSAAADVNKDNFVNVGDLQLLVAHWGDSLP